MVAHEQLISDLARDTVGQLSPRELPLFRATSQAYFKHPDSIQTSGKDEMIGFGAGDVTAMLTPVVLAVTTEVVITIVQQIKAVVKEEGGSLATDWIKLMFKRYRPEKETQLPPALTSSQLVQVREVALKKARQLKLSEANAKMLADAIVGGLAVAPARQP